MAYLTLNPQIQTCRRAFERHVSRMAYLRVHLCARAIQLAYKCHLARRITRRLRDLRVLLPRIIEQQRRHRGASVLQGAFLCHLARTSMRARAAQVTSCAVKRLWARNAYSATLAAMRLQSGVRMLWIHTRLRRKFARETICSRARGRLVNRLYAEKLARDSIACAVRMAWMHRRYVPALGSKSTCDKILKLVHACLHLSVGGCPRARSSVHAHVHVRKCTFFHLDTNRLCRWSRTPAIQPYSPAGTLSTSMQHGSSLSARAYFLAVPGLSRGRRQRDCRACGGATWIVHGWPQRWRTSSMIPSPSAPNPSP